ncbi:MAG: Clp protease ClpP [Chitinophagales bacterium]
MQNNKRNILVIGHAHYGRTMLCASLVASGVTAKIKADKTPLSVAAEAKNGVASIRIVGRISDWSPNNAQELSLKIDEFIAQGIKDCFIYINSSGGDVFQANEIVNLLQKFTGSKTGEGGAIVASAATFIACSLDTFVMAKNGQFMYHKPMGSFDGNEDQVESTLAALKNATKSYRELYAKKTGKKEEEIEAAWSKGDVWLSADEAKKQGFITGVKGEEPVTAETVELLRACGAPVIPDLTISAEVIEKQQQQQQNQNKMKLIALSLGLKEDAPEAEILAKLNELKVAAQSAATLKAEADAQKAAKQAADIKAVLDSAEKDHRIKPEMRANYEKQLKADFETAKTIIEALTPVTQLSAEIKQEQGDNDDRSKWTYEQWAEKDPEGLITLSEKDPAKFQALSDAYFK